MNPNLIPTEGEILEQATRIFPDNPELRASFITGVWLTVYKLKEKKNG